MFPSRKRILRSFSYSLLVFASLNASAIDVSLKHLSLKRGTIVDVIRFIHLGKSLGSLTCGFHCKRVEIVLQAQIDEFVEDYGRDAIVTVNTDYIKVLNKDYVMTPIDEQIERMSEILTIKE